MRNPHTLGRLHDGWDVVRNVKELELLEAAVSSHEATFAMLDEATGYALDFAVVNTLAEEAVENFVARFAEYDARRSTEAAA
jgi:hypothetical protein